MIVSDDTVICVQGEWDGWKTAEVRLQDLLDVHWRQPIRAPRSLVHGYVRCTDLLAGEIPHPCEHAGVPHRLLVCVIKRHNAPSAYEELVRRADHQRLSAPRPSMIAPAVVRLSGARGIRM